MIDGKRKCDVGFGNETVLDEGAVCGVIDFFLHFKLVIFPLFSCLSLDFKEPSLNQSGFICVSSGEPFPVISCKFQSPDKERKLWS